MQIKIDLPKNEEVIKITVEEYSRASKTISIPINDGEVNIEEVGNIYDIVFNLMDEIPYTVKERNNVENSANAFFNYVYDTSEYDDNVKEEDKEKLILENKEELV